MQQRPAFGDFTGGMFLAGGIVSKLVGFNTFSEVAEGATFPVFPVVHANQMQVLNLDSIEGRDEQGRIIDYRTMLVVYQDGVERCRGWTTVNNPLRCNGYTFHQATYTGNGAGSVTGFAVDPSGAIRLLNADGATAVIANGVNDIALSGNSRYLYALSVGDAPAVHAFRIRQDGQLEHLG